MSKRPRIFYLITRAEVAGAQTHLVELVREFKKRYGITIGCGEKDYLTQEAKNIGVEFVYFPSLIQPLNVVKDIRAFREIKTYLKANSFDLVHTHSSKAGLLGRIAASQLGIPCLFTAHGWGFTHGVPYWRRIIALVAEKLAAKRCEKIITVSEHDRQLALKSKVADAKKIVTIHNGITDSNIRANPGAEGNVRIAMIGRFARQKDHTALLRACVKLDNLQQVLLIGDGYTKASCERLASDLGIADRVKFLGERHDVEELLSNVHTYVLVSHWEGLPMSILEAMRAGLPVIASDVGGVKEAVLDGQTGYLVKSEEALTTRLQQLIDSPATRRHLGIAGREHFEKNFQERNMLNRVEAEYRHLFER